MSTTSYRPSNRAWLQRLFSGHPHQIIGDDPADPYLFRWSGRSTPNPCTPLGRAAELLGEAQPAASPKRSE